MPDFKRYHRMLPVLEVLQRLAKVAVELFPRRMVKVSIGTDIPGLGLGVDAIAEDVLSAPDVEKFLSSVRKSKLPLMARGYHVMDMSHPNAQQRPMIRCVVQAGELFSTLAVENFSDPDSFIIARDVVSSEFEAFDMCETVAIGLSPNQQETLRYQEGVTAELRAQVSRMATFSAEQLSSQNVFFRTLAIEQEQKRKEQDEAFARERVDLHNEYKAKAAELAQREQDLKDLSAAHKARDNTFVRRDLLESIKKNISVQETASLSQSTTNKRRPVQVAIGTVLIASLAMLVAFAAKAVLDPVPQWHHMIPLSASFALFTSTSIYMIRWSDQWFREHASAEFRAKRLSSDFLRASWLAELVFELKEKERQLPDVLVDRFSEGLFVDAPSKATEHPADQMVALLSKVTSIKAGKDGGELTMAAGRDK